MPCRIFVLVVITVAACISDFAAEIQVAERFAPVFYQALGDNPRSDYITNFDFDGDWRGDNNWANAANTRFPLKAYVYYSVSETATHYFIHYAVFHPRDYKGGETKGLILSDLIREGVRIAGGHDPTGLSKAATVAHENDMEGVLVVVEKNGTDLERARVRFVETLAHNRFEKYAVERQGIEPFKAENERVMLYIEPRGHGIYAYSGAERLEKNEMVTYRFTGRAAEPSVGAAEATGYALVPIAAALWPKARTASARNAATYGAIHDYGTVSISVANRSGRSYVRKVKVGKIGSAFLGKQGGQNMARPPWGWFDSTRREDPLGRWFFDPAATIKRDFNLDEGFSTTYSRLPDWANKL